MRLSRAVILAVLLKTRAHCKKKKKTATTDFALEHSSFRRTLSHTKRDNNNKGMLNSKTRDYWCWNWSQIQSKIDRVLKYQLKYRMEYNVVTEK